MHEEFRRNEFSQKKNSYVNSLDFQTKQNQLTKKGDSINITIDPDKKTNDEFYLHLRKKIA